MDHHDIAHAWQRLTGGPPQQHDDNNAPPLEPVVPTAPASIDRDVDMAAADSQHQSLEGDNVMPESQSTSSSLGSELGAIEVETQAVIDDHHDAPQWENDALPNFSLTPSEASATTRGSNRRARVDDDGDDDRDRRHPSQRTGSANNEQNANISSPSAANTSQPPDPLVQPRIPRPAGNRQDTFRLFQHFIPHGNRTNNPTPPGAGNANPNVAPDNNNLQPSPNAGAQPQLFSGFAITFDIARGQMPGLHHPRPGQPRDQGDAQNPPPPTDSTNPPFTNEAAAEFTTFAEAIARLGILGAAFGINLGESEVEDPERAKKLIAGLEEVPVGLVRRLERVGRSSSNGEELMSGGDSGCAICWDKLLGGDGDGFEKDSLSSSSSSEPTASVDSSATADTSSSSPSPSHEHEHKSESSGDPAHPRIVSLPCAHVFHADCLIPWFSRPRQTTCPTCRFNIDPENLTYVKRRRAPPAPPAPQTNPPFTPGAPVAEAQVPNPDADTPGGPRHPNMPGLGPILGIPPTPLASDPPGPTNTPAAPGGAQETLAAMFAAARDPTANPFLQAILRSSGQAVAAVTGTPPAVGTAAHTGTSGDTVPVVDAGGGGGRDQHSDLPLAEIDPDAAASAPRVSPATQRTADATLQSNPSGVNPESAALLPTQPLRIDNRHRGFVTIGFNMFIGPDTGDMGMMMDDMADEEELMAMEEEEAAGWERMMQDGGLTFPPAGNDTLGHPQHHPGTASTPSDGDHPAPPGGAPPSALGGDANAAPRPRPEFNAPLPGVNVGGGTRFATGAGRTMNEAFSQLFAGFGGPLPPWQQAQPDGAMEGPQQQPRHDGGPAIFPPHMFGGLGVPPMPAGPPPPAPAGGAPTPGGDAPTSDADRTLPAFNDMFGPPPSANFGMGPGPVRPTRTRPPRMPGTLLTDPFQRLFGGLPPSAGEGPGGPARFPGPGPMPPHMLPNVHVRTHGPVPPRPLRERKEWTPPPAPGPTLRQRIEKKEREAGLRCYDTSCGVGPSDEDPFVAMTEAGMKQLVIRPAVELEAEERVGAGVGTEAGASMCPHTFHPSCLVSSERVALRGAGASTVGDDVEVSCSVCRGVGCVSKAEWEEGVQALS